MQVKAFLSFGLPLLMVFLSFQSLEATRVDPDPEINLESLKTKADFEQAYDILKDRIDLLKIEKREADTKTEKKTVKNQLRDTREEIKAIQAKALSGGIYIGSGALLLIIILLILL